MAVIKYKNANGEYVSLDTGIPTNVSAFQNDSNYQNAEQVKQIINEEVPVAGKGLFVSPENTLCINTGSGLEVSPEGDLRTDSWLIPHDGRIVGEMLDDMNNQLEGVSYSDLWKAENLTWNENILKGDLVILNQELHNNIVANNDRFLLANNIQGEEFGRVFNCELTKQGNTFIASWENFEFTNLTINLDTNKVELVCSPNFEFIGRTINSYNLMFQDLNKFVRFIDVGGGLHQDVDNAGESRIIDINTGNGLDIDDNNRLFVDQNKLFNNVESYYPATKELRAALDLPVLTFDLDTDVNSANWVGGVVSSQPHLYINLEFNDGGWGGSSNIAATQSAVAANNNTYNYLWDMTSALGPVEEINTQLGIGKVEIAYNTSENKFYLILSMNDTATRRNLIYVAFGIRNENPSLAHYWIGNYDKWTINDNNEIDINDEYINQLIANNSSSSGSNVDLSAYYTKDDIYTILYELEKLSTRGINITKSETPILASEKFVNNNNWFPNIGQYFGIIKWDKDEDYVKQVGYAYDSGSYNLGAISGINMYFKKGHYYVFRRSNQWEDFSTLKGLLNSSHIPNIAEKYLGMVNYSSTGSDYISDQDILLYGNSGYYYMVRDITNLYIDDYIKEKLKELGLITE